MSAFDITGAICSFILFWVGTSLCKKREDNGEDIGNAPLIFVIGFVWFVFCVSRLFGAHL